MKKQNIAINYKVYLLALCALVLSGLGCKKSFLDLKPYNAVPVTSAIKSEADMYAALLGVYSSLRATDLYGRTFAVKGDLMSDDCFLSSSNSGRYLSFNQYNIASNDGYASSIWLNGYSAIKNANLIINSGLPNISDNTSQMYSEAYAIRGMVLFDLARNYSLPYAAGTTNLCVPIVLKFDQSSKPARDTVSKVYAQVLSDLTKAYSLAKFNQGSTMLFSATGAMRQLNSSYLTKYAIDGLLARVYQHMGNWAAARDAVLDIVNTGGFSLAPGGAGLVTYWGGTTPRTDQVETMFEVTSDANNSVSDGTLANLYVPKTNGGSYGDILATANLYSSYATTDARRGLYNPSTRSGQLGTAYYVTKYPINTTTYDDVKIVRYAEVLLILAEAYYNLADNSNALLYLNMVAQKRDPALIAYATSGTATLDQILIEREKELAFEGYRFWDLYRLQQTFAKPQAQDATNAIITSTTVTPTTANLIFPIPLDETLVNPNLKQNSGY